MFWFTNYKWAQFLRATHATGYIECWKVFYYGVKMKHWGPAGIQNVGLLNLGKRLLPTRWHLSMVVWLRGWIFHGEYWSIFETFQHFSLRLAQTLCMAFLWKKKHFRSAPINGGSGGTYREWLLLLPSSLVAAQSTLIDARVNIQPVSRIVSRDKCHLSFAPVPELQWLSW